MLKSIQQLIQIPLMLFLLITRQVDLFSRKCLLKLGCNQQPPPAGYKTPEDSPEELIGDLSSKGLESAVLELQAFIASRNDIYIDSLRSQLEQLVLNEDAPCYDPHLYAVLKPTRQENLDRIKNVFCQYGIEDLRAREAQAQYHSYFGNGRKTKAQQAGLELDLIKCYMRGMMITRTVSWMWTERRFATSKTAVGRYWAKLNLIGVIKPHSR